MTSIGIKNVLGRSYTGVYGGVPYDFAPGELKVIDSEVAIHLAVNSNMSAIGGKALKILSMEEIPEELRREPETKIGSLTGVENFTDRFVEIRCNGTFYPFPKGHVSYFDAPLADELVRRSAEGGPATLRALKAKPAYKEEKKEEKKKETKEKKEGK